MTTFARILTCFCLTYSLSGNAQQFRSFSQGFEVNTFINPGYAERFPLISSCSLFVKTDGTYRSRPQLPNGPSTLFFDGDLYWSPRRNGATLIGGAHFVRFNTNPIYSNRLSGRIAGVIPLSKTRHLSVGISPGVLQHRVATEQLLPLFPNDPVLADSVRVNRSFSIGAGVYFVSNFQWPWKQGSRYQEYFFLGYSMPRIGLPTKDSLKINQVTHHYLHAGFKSQIKDSDFYVEPVFLVKYVKNLPVQGEGVIRIIYKTVEENISDNFWVGVGIAGSKHQWLEMGHLEMGVGLNGGLPSTLRLSYTFSSKSYISAFNAALECLVTVVPFQKTARK